MFISDAYAQTAGAATAGGGLSSLALPIIMFGAIFFFMIRPQMKRAKEHKAMLETLAKGDEVITQGGVAGRIAQVMDNGFIKVTIAENVDIMVQKPSIGTVLPKGTLKGL